MSDAERLDERVRAIERTLTDGDATIPELESRADLLERVDELAERTAEIERRLDELDAAAQALRGYVGNVRSVNREVERRADAALAAVESLEAARDPEPLGFGSPHSGPGAPTDPEPSERVDRSKPVDPTETNTLGGRETAETDEERDGLAARLRGAL